MWLAALVYSLQGLRQSHRGCGRRGAVQRDNFSGTRKIEIITCYTPYRRKPTTEHVGQTLVRAPCTPRSTLNVRHAGGRSRSGAYMASASSVFHLFRPKAFKSTQTNTASVPGTVYRCLSCSALPRAWCRCRETVRKSATLTARATTPCLVCGKNSGPVQKA